MKHLRLILLLLAVCFTQIFFLTGFSKEIGIRKNSQVYHLRDSCRS